MGEDVRESRENGRKTSRTTAESSSGKSGSEEGTNTTTSRPLSSLPLGVSCILAKGCRARDSDIRPIVFIVMFCGTPDISLSFLCYAVVRVCSFGLFVT